MACKQKKGESLRAYYNIFTLETLNIMIYKEFHGTGAFAQIFHPVPPSKKMQGTISRSRDELEYKVKKYLRQIDGEERKETNLKVVVNAYIKHEEPVSRPNTGHRECRFWGHDKNNWHSQHLSQRYSSFVKEKRRSH